MLCSWLWDLIVWAQWYPLNVCTSFYCLEQMRRFICFECYVIDNVGKGIGSLAFNVL